MTELSPIFNLPSYSDASGNPLNGGKIFAYEAGSFSVLQNTYTDSTGLVANTNPIVLNSAGQLTTAIWLTSGTSYNLVLTESDGTTVIKNFDDVTGVSAGSSGGGGGTDLWVDTPTAIYLSPTQFLVSDEVSVQYAVGNRARVTVSGGFRYGTVTAVSYAAPNTTVTLANDGSVLDSSVSAAAYSLAPAAGRVVDAGAVSFFDALSYSTANTVGAKIKAIEADDDLTNTRIDAIRKVWDTTGTGTYTITMTPAVTSYSVDQVFTVKFGSAGPAGSTLNINGVGAKTLKSYDYTGAKVNQAIPASTVAAVAYDGTDFIVLTPVPEAPASAIPRGASVFAASGTFTVPDSVTTLKITAVGGGGGGGGGKTYGIDSPTAVPGGVGGGGATAMTYLTVTPGVSYAVSIGAAGGGGTWPSAGGNGGSTSFGITLAYAAGGSGGSPSGGFDSPGAAGTPGSTGTGLVLSGLPTGTTVGGGATYGSGGAVSNGGPGSAGQSGLLIVEY